MPGVARNYTIHLFSIQAKCYLRIRRKHEGCTALPRLPLCVVRAAAMAKVRLKFLYVLGGKIRYNGTTTMPGTRVSARDAHVHRLSRCARRDCHAVYVSPDLSRWLPRDETYPEIVQGTTEVHHELPDPSFPQTDAVLPRRTRLRRWPYAPGLRRHVCPQHGEQTGRLTSTVLPPSCTRLTHTPLRNGVLHGYQYANV